MNYSIFLKIWIVKLLFPKYYLLPTALIYSQADHETGNFQSPISKFNLNIFGMKQPRVRKTTALGTKRGHAYYSTHWHSIYDYFLRQNYFNIDYQNTKQYVEDTFESAYAEDRLYREKWLAHFYSIGVLRYISYLVMPVILVFVISLFMDHNKKQNFWENVLN